MALSARQRKFVEEYLVDLNASAAARRAGYSVRTAKQAGSRLLTKADVQAALTKAQRARQERTQVTADNVVKELAAIGFARFTDVVGWQGGTLELRPSTELEEKTVAAVREISETQYGLRVRFHDKLQALALLAKHTGVDQAGPAEDPQDTVLEIRRFVQAAGDITGGPAGESAFEPDPDGERALASKTRGTGGQL